MKGYFSQNTNTNLTKVNSRYCYSEAQVNEIFKGLKQTEYLKVRLQKTEETLQNADKVISQQKDIIISKTEAINLKEEILARDGKLVIRPDCYSEDTLFLTNYGWKILMP